MTSTPLHQPPRQEPEFRPPLEPSSLGAVRRTTARGRSATGLRRSLLSDFDAANVTTWFLTNCSFFLIVKNFDLKIQLWRKSLFAFYIDFSGNWCAQCCWMKIMLWNQLLCLSSSYKLIFLLVVPWIWNNSPSNHRFSDTFISSMTLHSSYKPQKIWKYFVWISFVLSTYILKKIMKVFRAEFCRWHKYCYLSDTDTRLSEVFFLEFSDCHSNRNGKFWCTILLLYTKVFPQPFSCTYCKTFHD